MYSIRRLNYGGISRSLGRRFWTLRRESDEVGRGVEADVLCRGALWPSVDWISMNNGIQ